jgi:spore coat protein U-like protein
MKFPSIVAAASLTFFATPALAQTQGGEISFDIQGTIADACTVQNLSVDSVSNLTLNNIVQALGTVLYVCNDPDGFTRTISSANGGSLNDNLNEIPYTLYHSSSDDIVEIEFENVSLGAERVDLVPSSAPVLAGTTGVISAKASALGFPAGVYTDTVTITVVAR